MSFDLSEIGAFIDNIDKTTDKVYRNVVKKTKRFDKLMGYAIDEISDGVSDEFE